MAFFKKGPEIAVRVKVAGFINNKMVTAEFDIRIPESSTLKKLFKLVDKSGKVPARTMSSIMLQPKTPTVLINGDNIDVPDQLDTIIKAGDEIAVMTPLGGG
jgi:molybdopterin converting factor small subunit